MTSAFELLIIGGGPAGMSAARGYREVGGDGPVGIVADEHRMPYRRPPLTKELLRGETREDELPLEDETWPSAHGVDLISGRATRLDPEAGSVMLSGGRPLPLVSLVSDEPAPNAARLSEQAGSFIAHSLEEQGVELHLASEVQRIERAGHDLRVIADGASAGGQLVVMATGVAPRSELAAAAGLELDGGAVPVDASMRAAASGLLAAGDACKAHNVSASRSLRVEHWGDALSQGEIAGASAAGKEVAWDAVPGFWSTIGDRTLKYAAWGDGHDRTRVQPHADAAFTVWYGRDDRLVGVLTHCADDDHDRGRELIREGAPWS